MPAAIDPQGFEAIDGSWNFDIETYRGLGLNLSRLEDPSEDGLMSRLRMAAVEYGQPNGRQPLDPVTRALEDAHERVKTEMAKSQARLEATLGRGVTAAHPAIRAYVEREPEKTRQGADLRLGLLRLVGLELVRPNRPQDASDKPFGTVHLPGTNFYSTAAEVADQLTLARVALHFDL